MWLDRILDSTTKRPMDSQTTEREKDRQMKGLKKPTNWNGVMRKYVYPVHKISYHQPLCSRKQDYGGLLGGKTNGRFKDTTD